MRAEYGALAGTARPDPAIIVAAGFVLKDADFYGRALSDAVTDGLDAAALSSLAAQSGTFFAENLLVR